MRVIRGKGRTFGMEVNREKGRRYRRSSQFEGKAIGEIGPAGWLHGSLEPLAHKSYGLLHRHK